MTILKKVIASGGLLVLIGAGCTADTTTDNSASSGLGVGDETVVGDIVHVVNTAEVMDTIPASETLPEWEAIAEDLPVDDGFQWVHITGDVTNNSNVSQIMDSTSVHVQDGSGNEFKVSTDTIIYVDSDEYPVFLELQPTQTKPWEAYFMVPAGAEGLSLYANDLSFLPEDEVMIDLGL